MLLPVLLWLGACQSDRLCKCGYGRAEDGLCYPVVDPDGAPACQADTGDTGP